MDNHSLHLNTTFRFSIRFFSGPLNDDDSCYHRATPSRKKSPTAHSPEPRRGRSHCLLPIFKHRRPTQSADFGYDPSSYALNFEDHIPSEDEEFPFRDFSSRLKKASASPPPSARLPEELAVTVDCRV